MIYFAIKPQNYKKHAELFYNNIKKIGAIDDGILYAEKKAGFDFIVVSHLGLFDVYDSEHNRINIDHNILPYFIPMDKKLRLELKIPDTFKSAYNCTAVWSYKPFIFNVRLHSISKDANIYVDNVNFYTDSECFNVCNSTKLLALSSAHYSIKTDFDYHSHEYVPNITKWEPIYDNITSAKKMFNFCHDICTKNKYSILQLKAEFGDIIEGRPFCGFFAQKKTALFDVVRYGGSSCKAMILNICNQQCHTFYTTPIKETFDSYCTTLCEYVTYEEMLGSIKTHSPDRFFNERVVDRVCLFDYCIVHINDEAYKVKIPWDFSKRKNISEKRPARVIVEYDDLSLLQKNIKLIGGRYED